MSRWWKFLWVSIVVLLGLLLMLPFILNNIDLNQFRSSIEARVTALTGRQLKIDGDLQFNLSLHPSLKIESVSFANPPWSEQPQMVAVDELQLKIDLMPLFDKQMVIEELLLRGVVLIAEKNSADQKNWLLESVDSNGEINVDSMNSPGSFMLSFVPVLKHVQFDDVSIRYSDVNADIETDFEFKILRLSNHAINEPFTFNASGTINDYPFVVTGETNFQSDTDGNDNSLVVKVDADAIGISLSVNGKIKEPILKGGIDVNVSLLSQDINKTFISATGRSLTEYSVNTDEIISLQLSTRFSNLKGNYELSAIRLKIADSDLNGSVSLLEKSGRSQIHADLHSEKINLNQVLAKRKSRKEKEGEKVSGASNVLELTDTPFKFEWLKKIDADIKYDASQILVYGFSPKNISFGADLKRGRLRIDKFNFDINDSQIRSHLFIDGGEKTPVVKAVAVIKKFDLMVLKKYPGFAPLQQGKLDAEINIDGQGDDVRALLLSLSGESQLHLTRLKLKQEVAGKKRSFDIEKLDLRFAGMNASLAYELKGAIDNQAVLLSGNIATMSTLLNNNATHFITKADVFETSLYIDAVSEEPLFLNSVQADAVISMSNLEKSFDSLAQFIPDIKTTADLPALPASIKTRLNITSDNIDAENIEISVGNNDLKGEATVNLSKEKIFLKADVSSELLDLNSLFPLLGKKKPEHKKTPAGDKLFSTKPLPSLSALDLFNADIHYELKKLVGNNQGIKNILLDLVLNEGKLHLKPLKMQLDEGAVNIHLVLSEGDTLKFQTTVDIKKLDYDRLMAFLGTKEYARGYLDAEIDLQGAGDSVSSLMAGLNGKVRVATEGGSMDSDAMKLLSKDIISLIPFTDNSDRQKIRCAVMQFDIDDGVARTHALVLDTGVVSALGAGDIDLSTEILSMYVSPRTKRTSVMELVLVPFNVTGTLVSPSVTPDLAGTTFSTTKKAVNITLAFATGGITLLAEDLTNKLWGQFIDDTDYCALALAGKKVVPTLVKLKEDGDDFDANKKDADHIEELDDDDFDI